MDREFDVGEGSLGCWQIRNDLRKRLPVDAVHR